MKNKCVYGNLDGLEFEVSTPTMKIDYQSGYYLKSALREGEDNVTLWVWHKEDEEPISPVNPG